MEKIESIEAFYKNKFEWMPDNIRNEIGHFNVFCLEPVTSDKPKPVYKRRDFFKIMLVLGNIKINYADKVIGVRQQALSFSNPQIPYSCEALENMTGGFFCIFNQHFFHQYGDLNQYAVFQPTGDPVFELSEEQTIKIKNIYEQMFAELNSDYVHKYDILRNLIFEIIHFALKMQPSSQLVKQPINASQRISTLFLEILERQFPIDENHPAIQLRCASDFAKQLNIHVNHLNRAVKAATEKTTTQLIGERVLQEAKILLKHSHWNIAAIAYSLGFVEVTHFNNFFKKHALMNPSQFRNV
jgi:AraC family transcriptional regulator, transcriptional activator of pobA